LQDYNKTNIEFWEKIIPIHQNAKFYEMDSFLKGNSTLKMVEEEEIGDVNGKSILLLLCHFGLHTLSLARKGAHVVGVDYSREAIKLAKELSCTTALKAEFICANIYDLPDILDRKFDIVFTSYGVLYCLNDLNKWGQVIATYLKKDGLFYIVELHPIFYMLDEEGKRFVNPYFHNPEPTFVERKPAYVDLNSGFQTSFYEWRHSLSDVVNAVINAGLKLEFLHEFPFIVYGIKNYLVEDSPGKFRIKNCENMPPLMFSLKARHDID